MAYVIEALIGAEAVLRKAVETLPEARIVPLRSGFALIPITKEVFDLLGGGDCGGFLRLSNSVEDLARRLSQFGPTAYVEAEYFGGVGTQTSVVWNHGKRAMEVLQQENAINRALAKLGVVVQNAHDEFGELGLGRCRTTGEWLKRHERTDTKQRMTGYFRELSVAAALALLLLVLAFAAPAFFARQQLLTTLTTAAPVLIVACGMTLVIIARQIDISVGSQFALCSIIAGLLAKSGMPMPIAALGAIGCGAVMGAFNGVLVAGLGLPSIVVTLATMVTWREALRWWREGEFVKDLPDRFQWFGFGQGGGQAAILLGAVLVFGALVFAMKHFAAGRFVYAVGSDREAARLAGIRAQGVTFGVFVLMGALVGVAALLNAIRFADVDPKTGTGLEMQTIAAVVVGGVAISGGRGNLWGVLAGVLLLACIAPALVFLQMPPQWEKAIQGGIILLAVATDGWRSRKESHG